MASTPAMEASGSTDDTNSETARGVTPTRDKRHLSGLELQPDVQASLELLRSSRISSRPASTSESYFHAARGWARFALEVGVSALPADPVHVAAYAEWLVSRGYAAPTVAKMISAVVAWHAIVGADTDEISRIPRWVTRSSRRSHTPERPDSMTLEEYKRLILALFEIGGAEADNLRLYLLLAVRAARRATELAGVRTTDVKLHADGRASVTFTKAKQRGGAQETLTVGYLALSGGAFDVVALLHSRVQAGDDYLVLVPERVKRSTVGAWVARSAVKLTGLRSFSSRSLRRTGATLLYDSTGDLSQVQRLLGHKRLETTRRYIAHGQRSRKRASLAAAIVPTPEEFIRTVEELRFRTAGEGSVFDRWLETAGEVDRWTSGETGEMARLAGCFVHQLSQERAGRPLPASVAQAARRAVQRQSIHQLGRESRAISSALETALRTVGVATVRSQRRAQDVDEGTLRRLADAAAPSSSDQLIASVATLAGAAEIDRPEALLKVGGIRFEQGAGDDLVLVLDGRAVVGPSVHVRRAAARLIGAVLTDDELEIGRLAIALRENRFQESLLRVETASASLAMLTVAAARPIRAVDLAALSAHSVTFTKNAMRVELPSGHHEDFRQRNDGLCPVAAVRRYLSVKMSVGDHLFTDGDGEPVTAGTIARVLATLSRRAGLSVPVRSSDLRATAMVNVGRLAADGGALDSLMMYDYGGRASSQASNFLRKGAGSRIDPTAVM